MHAFRHAIRRFVPAALLLAAGLVASFAGGGEIWDGGGANDNWTTAANWNGIGFPPLQFPPPNNGTANIHFAGNQGTLPNVDIPYSINSLTFDSGSNSFIINGQELTIGSGGVTTNDNSNQIVFAPVKLAANQMWTAAAGLLAMDVINLNGFDLTINGAFPVTLGDSIGGAGELIVANTYTGAVTMSGNSSNTHTGFTTVENSTLNLQKTGGATAVSGRLSVQSGATARLGADEQISNAFSSDVHVQGLGGLFDLNGHTESVYHLSVSSNASAITGAGMLTILHSLYVTSDGTVSGNVSLGDVLVLVQSNGQLTTGNTLFIGDDADGSLSITTGGDVTNGVTHIGHQSGSTGTVTVDGNNSTWINNGNLRVGYGGTGSLDITAGADVSNTVGEIGVLPGAIGAVTVDGLGSTWINSNSLYVGENGSGTLDIVNQGSVTATSISINSNGNMNVSSGGSFATIGALTMNGGSLTADADAVVDLGGGELRNGAVATVQDGASFTHAGTLSLRSDATLQVQSGASGELAHLAIGTAPGPEARFLVDGAGTLVTSPLFINVGLGGTGAMTVTDGAHVQTASGAVGGFAAGTMGTLTLDGTDASGNASSWTLGTLNVGFHATSQGTISILNGVRLEVTTFNVANPGSASVLVDGTDGLGNPSLLDVGTTSLAFNSGANGEIIASAGGRIESGNISMALNGGTATLTVTDANSTFVQSGASTITVGHATDGAAVLNVLNGATLTSGTGAINVYGAGEINLDSGAVFDARGPINVNGGEFNFLGGTLHVDAFNGNLLNEGGALAPGHSVGHTAISGNYTQREAATLEIEIGGVFPGEWDTLAVTGNASLDGVLEVKLLGGFEPVLGNSFTILTTDVGNVGGVFDIEVMPVVNGVTFDVVYGAKSVMLVAQPGFTADFDNDGDVDAADLLKWQGDFGPSTSSDADNDGDSDGADFLAWQQQLGSPLGVAAGGAVPEPMSAVLTAIGLAAMACRRPQNWLLLSIPSR